MPPPEGDFACGKCDSPLKIDPSLQRLSKAQTGLLISKNKESFNALQEHAASHASPHDLFPPDRLAMYEALAKKADDPVTYRKMIESVDDSLELEEDELSSPLKTPSSAPHTPGHSSYVLLGNSTESTPAVEEDTGANDHAISLRIKALSRIFDILSSHQDIDHPLSQECAELLLDNLRLKFDQTQVEKDTYLAFLRKLKEKEAQAKMDYDGNYLLDLDLNMKQVRHEREQLEAMEQAKLAELEMLEREKAQLDETLRQQQDELRRLETQELDELAQLSNKLRLDYNEQVGTVKQLEAAYNSQLDHLDYLRNTNVYTMIFDIATDSTQKYGTINGLRLGYQISWSEINAALGQCVLLLKFMTERLGTDLQDYELVPMGSESKIIRYSNSNEDGQVVRNKLVLNMFSTSDFSLGKLFNFNKLDVAMILFVQVMSLVQQNVQARDPDAALPYAISRKGDTLGGKSIRVTSNAEWTTGCRLLLTDLKWLLAYISTHTQPTTEA